MIKDILEGKKVRDTILEKDESFSLRKGDEKNSTIQKLKKEGKIRIQGKRLYVPDSDQKTKKIIMDILGTYNY